MKYVLSVTLLTNTAIRNFGILFAFMAVFCAVHLLSAEFIPSQRSKGEVLLFRRRHAMERRRANDIEKNDHDTFVDQVNVSNHAKSIDVRHQDDDRQASSVLDTIQAQSAVLHWKNLSYEVKNHDGKILNSINGWVKPGTLMALMVNDALFPHASL